MANLFTPMVLNGLALPNRIWMSAMTRTRATAENVPTSLMGEYFAQRAAAGLIVTDCTAVSEQGKGIINGPGIWRDDQIEGWKVVTNAVHAAGGRIYCQLWHCGRVAHPQMRGGELPVAPSPLPAKGKYKFPDHEAEFPIPHELAAAEIPKIIEDFAQATRNARIAGFDGVELHGANGYLHDQFLQDVSNRRTDRWGGAIENRSLFMLETIEAMANAWSTDRIGIRLGPSTSLYGMGDSDPLKTFGYLVKQLDRRKIGYLTMLEPNRKELESGVQVSHVAQTFRPMTTVPFIANTGFDKASGMDAIASGNVDAVAYGTLFLANPDLVARFASGDREFNKPDPKTFYGTGPNGYTNYPLRRGEP
ncbi:alkene reductase [Rhizobium sp. ZPR3]|uniref:Alkene reductase n=2 Tax=unclassified Rhizobium TaxID=2613769 RepID=A0AAU7SPG9_9HYPH